MTSVPHADVLATSGITVGDHLVMAMTLRLDEQETAASRTSVEAVVPRSRAAAVSRSRNVGRNRHQRR